MTDSTAASRARGQIDYDASAALTLASRAKRALDCAEIVIDSDALLEVTAEDLKAIKALQHEVEEQRSAITRPLNQAVRAINELFRPPREYLEAAERHLKRSIMQYTSAREKAAEQARRAAEEQARIEREELARHEREQERLAWEAQQQADLARQQAERAAAAGDAQAAASAQAQCERLAAQAERAERARIEAAAATQAADVITIAPEVAPPARLAGISARVSYSAQVTDLALLVRAVAEGKAPLECVQANDNASATAAIGEPKFPR